MKKILMIILISLITLTIVGCSRRREIAEVKEITLINWTPLSYYDFDRYTPETIENVYVEISFDDNTSEVLRISDVALSISGDVTIVGNNLQLHNNERIGEHRVQISYGGVTVTVRYDVGLLGMPFVQVGNPGITYTVPVGCSEEHGCLDTRQSVEMEGGFLMATRPTTYKLWYEIREWAINRGYAFQNSGREGSTLSQAQANQVFDTNFDTEFSNYGYTQSVSQTGPCSPPFGSPDHPLCQTTITYFNTGDPTTVRGKEPVVHISLRDVIVWVNALSEWAGLDPVYWSNDSVYKNSNIAPAIEIRTSNNGFRLPTSDEWEMAARWKNDTVSTHGSILVGGRYWTPHNYASGATGVINNTTVGAVAWFSQNSEGRTHPVGEKLPNHLGLFDMSGNVLEWTSSLYGKSVPHTDDPMPISSLSSSNVRSRGGSYNSPATNFHFLGVTDYKNTSVSLATSDIGFRIAINNPS